jgi:uncharacterized membrane protein YcaP (DUF421 family)
MENYELILLKLTIGFVGLWIMTRLLGKKELSQLNPFDFISAMIMSEIVGNTIYEKQNSYVMLLFALAVWTCLSLLFEKLTQHVKKLRKPLEGEPVLLIREGKLDIKKMRENSLDFDQLRMMLRSKDVFSMHDVAYAIYETNGSLSVLKKSAYDAVQRDDLQLQTKQRRLPCTLIEDGDVQDEMLSYLGRDEAWLRLQLQQQGYSDLGEIAYAELSEDDKVLVIPVVRGISPSF